MSWTTQAPKRMIELMKAVQCSEYGGPEVLNVTGKHHMRRSVELHA